MGKRISSPGETGEEAELLYNRVGKTFLGEKCSRLYCEVKHCALHCTSHHCQPSFSTVRPIYFRVSSKMHLKLNSVKFVTSCLWSLISLISTSRTTCQVGHHLSTRWEREEEILPSPGRPSSGSCSPRQLLGLPGAQRRGCFQTLFGAYLEALEQDKYLNILLLF